MCHNIKGVYDCFKSVRAPRTQLNSVQSMHIEFGSQPPNNERTFDAAAPTNQLTNERPGALRPWCERITVSKLLFRINALFRGVGDRFEHNVQRVVEAG